MKICAVMMQKNEGVLLDRWIEFHERTFQLKDMFIFDNCSSQKETNDILDKWSAQGVQVFRNNPDFSKKGAVISKFVQENGSSYDWCFPLDCDEFLCVAQANNIGTGRATVQEELVRTRSGVPLLRMSQYVLNVPYTTRGFAYPAKKVIVRGGATIQLDTGYHLYSWERGKDMVDPSLIDPSNFLYLHFHNKPFSKVLEAARAKLTGRIKSFTRTEIEGYVGEGRHLTKYLLMSEIDYLESFTKREIELGEIFSAQRVTFPFS